MKPYLKRAWAEISLGTLESNIEKIKSILSDNTQIMAVIKADAYGKIILPEGDTISPVLRVKTTQTIS